MQDFRCIVHEDRRLCHGEDKLTSAEGMSVRCVIIGNGVAALEAAVTFRQYDREAELIVISDESRVPFSRPALMYVFMGQLRFKDTQLYDPKRLEQLHAEFVQDRVTGIDVAHKQLTLNSARELQYDRLLIATGSMPRSLNFEKEDNLFGLENVCGFYHLVDLEKLDRLSRKSRRAVITGGGLIGIEVAEMLQSRGIEVDFVVREPDYWRSQIPAWESRRLSERIRSTGIRLHLSDEVASVRRDGQVIREVHTKGGLVLESDLFVVSIGVQPNIGFLRPSAIQTDTGVLVDEFQRTSIDHVFAAGDCAEIQLSGSETRIEKVWYTAKAQGAVAGANLAGQGRRYDAGLWFNSAKFFDLEYQVYGDIPVNDQPGDVHHLSEAVPGGAMLRVVEREGRVIGMSGFGVRLRHRAVEAAILAGEGWTSLKTRLAALLFDAEFTRHVFEFRQVEASSTPEQGSE